MSDPMSTPNHGGRTNPAADITATILLLVVHAFLVAATLALLSLLVMVTDACGAQRCGGQTWIDRAMVLGLGGGGAIFIATLVIAVLRLGRHQLAFFVPAIGCVAQLALAIGAAAMESMAGPV
jgi:hypothetical protein